MTTMRAMLLENPGQPLVLRHLEVPAPGPGQVLLRVRACGVCRTDLHLVDNELPDPRLPIIPGHEIVGVVDELGDGSDRFAVGAFLCALGFVVTLNVANPDEMIVGRNLERYEETGDLDTSYLHVLSDDAVPAITAGLGRMDRLARHETEELLYKRLASKNSNAGWRKWQSYNLARWRAYDALTATLGPDASD